MGFTFTLFFLDHIEVSNESNDLLQSYFQSYSAALSLMQLSSHSQLMYLRFNDINTDNVRKFLYIGLWSLL
jgi:hypothetical protein